MSYPRRSQLSRADLLAATVAGDADAAAYLAKKLGLERECDRDDAQAFTPISGEAKISLSASATVSRGQTGKVKPGAGFWLLEKREATVLQQDENATVAETAAFCGWQGRPTHKPAYYPLASPRSLLPRLFQHLKQQRQGRGVDADAVVKKLGKGEHLYHIPRTHRRSLGRHLHIIEDHHLHLTPYWLDQSLYADLLSASLPEYAYSHDLLREGQADGWILPPENSVVLVFSDLGALSDNPAGQVASWRVLAQHLQRLGCKLIAVVPCHPDECDPRLRALFTLEPWEPLRQTAKLDKTARRQQVSELLGLLAPAIRIEPGLLRAVRLAAALHGQHVPASVEAAVWQHPDIPEKSSVAATPNPAARNQWLERFAVLPEALKQTVLDTIREWREPLREQVWFEEITSLDSASRDCVPPSDLTDASRYFHQLGLRYERDADELRSDVDTRTWFRRMEKRLPMDAWELPEVGAALQRVAVQVHKGDQRHHADHTLDPAKLPPLGGYGENGLDLYQQGESLVLSTGASSPDSPLACTSHLAHIRLRRPLLYAETFASANNQRPAARHSLQFQLSARLYETVCPLGDDAGLLLRSDMETLHFRQVRVPPWAYSIGRDPAGLFIEHHCLGAYYRPYWQPPTANGLGHWQGFPPGEIGTDDYGPYADVGLPGSIQRFRWVKPGTFLMGSPESEPEREPWIKGSETQHPVILTQGFWLADTTVTQAQWQAVMGNNPSSFTDDPNNPVEQVSWDDAQAFTEKLRQQIPGLAAKLPTEAQWEYACRAGTSTPFSFGDNITPKQVNYDGNYPYAGGKKGLYRQKTVPVKSFPANPWGLYEMHGNVWEWCQDVWQEKLPPEAVTDPQGVAGGDKAGVGRVIRGGSWGGDGWGCRSACRLGLEPVERNCILGFRLVLGHIELRPGQGGGAATQARADGAGMGSGVAEQPQTMTATVAGKSRKKPKKRT
jgi:formylglycine-generating enzyme required for sulfatase activity